MLAASGGWAAPLSVPESMQRAKVWMEGNPILEGHAVRKTVVFDSGTSGYALHVFHLTPQGYLIANSDSRLPVAVAFSDRAELVLKETEANTLHAFLSDYQLEMAEALKGMATEHETVHDGVFAMRDAENVLIEPLLDTTWSQHHPYNLHMPEVSGGTEYYGYRAPTGCVATAYAQILNYHRWPVHGTGGYRYTDTAGSTTGTFSADFREPYDWGNMLSGYSAFAFTPEPAQTAIARLMYDLAVAKEANFEANETSANTDWLGRQLACYFFFESGMVEHRTSDQATVETISAGIIAGYPAILSIPGHAVVADGLMTASGGSFFHINYGWGGVNDGWFTPAGIPGGAMDRAYTGIRPALMPFARESVVASTAGQPVALDWIFPRHRESEAQSLRLFRWDQRAGQWSSNAEDFGFGASVNGWRVVPNGFSGAAWYAGPNGPATLVLGEMFVPHETTALRFKLRHKLGTAALSVEVSTDDGLNYATLRSWSKNTNLNWSDQSVDLSAYAGQSLRVRFRLTRGSFHSDGGVWLDDLSINANTWSEWTFWRDADAMSSRRFSSERTLWDAAEDFSGFEVTSTSTEHDWVIGSDPNEGSLFYKEPGRFWNRFYHLTSTETIQPETNTRLVVRSKFHFATDYFRISVSTDRVHFTELATLAGTSGWADHAFALGDYAGQPIYVRLEYVVGNFYESGGLWIASVSTETVTHPELEGQPVHSVVITSPDEGEYVLAGQIIDAAGQAHRVGPGFILEVSQHEVGPVAAKGTPHAWLVEMGFVEAGAPAELFDLAELSDPSGKGVPLWVDFVTGSDPLDPQSRFRAPIARRPGGEMVLQFRAFEGRRYVVEKSDSLAKDSWVEWEVLTVEQDNEVLSVDLPPPTTTPSFFRVRVSLE